MITGHKRKGPTKHLQVYGKDLERVKQFKLIKKLDIIWSKTLRVHRMDIFAPLQYCPFNRNV